MAVPQCWKDRARDDFGGMTQGETPTNSANEVDGTCWYFTQKQVSTIL